MNDNTMAQLPSATITAVCEQQLTELVEDTDGAVFAMIATVDGFPVSSTSAQGWDIPVNRMAAMASSGHALGNSVSGEIGSAECENVIIDADRLSVVFLAVPKLDNPPLILVAAAKKSASLGTVLYGSKRCAQRIGDSEDP